MKKKKVAKRIIAMTLAFTLCMQSAAVYAMDENDFQSITFEEEIDTENEDENYSVDQEDGEEELTITDDYEEEDPAVEFSDGDLSENDDSDEVFVDVEEGESEETGASVSDFSYEELNGSYVSITGYTGAEKNVVIPDSIDGFIVQKIGNGAFKNKDIESIKFPDRMDYIGDEAFKGCTLLKTIDFNKVKGIGRSAFEGCTSLKEVEFPGSLTSIGNWGFYNCTGLSEVRLPDTLTTLGRNSFADCTNLSKTNYPMSLSSAGESIFAGDSRLKSITVPEGVKKLPDSVFKNCTNFTEIILPESLKEIGVAALEGCTGLTAIRLPSGLTSIGNWSFNNCTGLTEIQLPDTLTKLGRNSFADCTNLSSINYPKNLSSAGESIFDGDSKLKSITVPDGVEKLPDNMFQNCTNFTEIILPESLKEIGGAALEGCTGLAEIRLPSGLTSIGNWGFYNCTGLRKVQLPDTITTLGKNSFANCTSLSSINYPKNLSSAGESIFDGDSKLKSITVPEGVEKLPDNVFKNCGNFSRIILPATLKVIGNSALEGINLERMVLPDSVTTIGAYAFCNCSLLEQIWIGKNVTEIHDRSFNGCKTEKLVIHGVAGSYAQEWSTAKGFKFDTEVMGQNDLIINGKVTAQGAGLPDVRVDVYDCNRTKTVYVAYTDAAGSWSYNEAQAGTRYKIHYSHARYKFETNDTEVTVNENLQIPEIKATAISGIPEENPEKEFTFESLTGNSVKITGYSGNGDAVVIPATLDGKEVQVLGDNVFRGRKEIKTVVLPEGLVEIQAETFKDCDQLSCIRFSTTLSRIGRSAFEGCTSLKEVEFPGSLTSIGNWGFYNCTGLSEVRLPDTLTTLGRNSFADCTNLSKTNYPMSLSSAGESIFAGDSRLKSITVPDGVKKLPDSVFKNCTNFTEIILPESLKEIGGAALEGCTGLTEIRLPSGLTSIGNWGFYNCTGLTEIQLPDTLTKLGRNSFADCTNLNKINYPKNLSSAGESIFDGDSKLKSITVPDGVEKLPDSVFKNCTNFTEIILPKSLKEIGGAALEGCTGLAEIRLPSGLTSIGNWGFYNCTGLREVQLPDTITTLGKNSFANCTSLSSINYPKNLSSAGESIFDGDSKLKSITVPEGVEKLPDNMFKNCSRIRYINLPSTLKVIGASAFEGCKGLPSINIPRNVNNIGNYAFYGCTGLITITIPESITSLNRCVFANCSNLTKVYIPDSVNHIEDNTFEGSSGVVFYCSYNSYATIYAIDKKIPFISTGMREENQNSVLDQKNTSYYGDFNSMTSNGYVAMTMKYKVKDDMKNAVSGLAVEITLPSNAEFDESTLKVDGLLSTDYKYDGGRNLRIPLSNTEGVIRYSVKIKEQSDTTSSARIFYTCNGEQTNEIIGIINEAVSVFTIDAPEITSEETVYVSGVAPASSEIILKIDGKTKKEIKASKAGLWSGSLQLENPVDYREYKIDAECKNSSLKPEAKVVYHEGEPSLTSFKMHYNEHNEIKTCDILNTDGVLPVVYYLPGTKFDYELSFKNADQIKEIYVTSTRNNETKYLKATYNEKKQAFVTDGYFDENNHNYVPGIISYEYNKPAKSATVGQEVDWDKLKNNLLEDTDKALKVTQNTASDYKATIDLSSLGKEFADVAIDAKISVFDENHGTDLGVWKGLMEENDTILSYILPGYDDKKYICNLDYSDAGTWYMLVKDVSGNKYIGLILDTAIDNSDNLDKTWDLIQVSSRLSAVNTAASMLYKNYQIETDMDQLRKDVMSSGGYSSNEELNKVLKSVDDLEYDQKMFMIMTTILPLVVAGPAVVGATMSAAPMILFTALLGAMTASSSFFWSVRKANIKGEKYKSKFIIDPSGYVYDQTTGERLENVTVTAYCIEYDESSDFWNKIPSAEAYGEKWNALEYNQQNPLLTNADGKYAWDVPEGWWRVKYEKEGYETAWSDWMTVPPLQTEVNIGLQPNGKVEKEHRWDKGTIQVRPTCTTTGIISYTCLDCGQTKTEVLATDPKNHGKLMTEPARKPTCLKAGRTEKIYCAMCKAVIKESRTINKLKATIRINVAGTLPLTVKQTFDVKVVAGTGDGVAFWKSSAPKIVSVRNGRIKGLKAGTATITVQLKSGLKKSFKVKVQKKAVATTSLKITDAVSGKKISKNITLKCKKSLRLKATVAPVTSRQKVIWSSSNKKVATVTSKGVITAKKKGKTIITVKSGKKTYKIKVTVK